MLKSFKISVVLNTYNSEKYLDRVLSAVRDADEILICDMYSKDNTVEIAKKFGAKIIYHDNTGYVEPARNFAIQSTKNEWVLLLDSDELITPYLKDKIKHLITHPECSAYYFPRKNYFLGRWMRSAYPDYVCRLFRKNDIDWPKEIHSQPKINGKIEKLNYKDTANAIEHLADENVSLLLNKTNQYTTAEITKRKAQNITLLKLIFSPSLWFFKFYFLKGGVRDGIPGFIFSVLKAHYKFITLAKLYESKYKR
ncbi:glycosyltransferase family 2 protein [Riemerella anatipestifer]|nr:glycosyltransferase family 2 protein [Riemerella anatipestifer]